MRNLNKRNAAALAALGLTAVLSACSGNLLEARPVCLAPHGGANVQLAPSYLCETGVAGHAWVNGQGQQVAVKDK
jgi:hypothetical protein